MGDQLLPLPPDEGPLWQDHPNRLFLRWKNKLVFETVRFIFALFSDNQNIIEPILLEYVRVKFL